MTSRIFFDFSVDRSVFVRRAVVVAKCDERSKFQPQIFFRFRMVVVFQFIVDHGTVLWVRAGSDLTVRPQHTKRRKAMKIHKDSSRYAGWDGLC